MKNGTIVAALFLLGACGVSDEAGTQLIVGVVHHFAKQADGTYPEHAADEPRVFTTAENVQITLTRGFIVLQSIEIVGCETASLGRTIWRNIYRGLTLLPEAHAHSLSSGTRLGEPFVEHILGEDLLMNEVGDLEPPQGRYCQIRIVVGPADDDAANLPADTDMVGHSLILEGTYAMDGADPQPFVLTSDKEQTLTLDLAEPQEFSKDHLDATVVIGMHYNTWLDGVDFSATPEAQSSDAFANAVGSLHVHMGPYQAGDEAGHSH